VTIAELFLKEFDPEMETTRRVLERVPAGKLDWRPHAKSMSMRELSGHVADLPRWGTRIDDASFEVGSRPRFEFETTEQLLERFDRNVAESRESIARRSDDALRERFLVTRGGQPFFHMSKASVLRRVFLNHLIHHRGQLSVYLRLNDVPLPAIYGRSADEGPAG
jgi:uncharacterized damage-inducible protein DinB